MIVNNNDSNYMWTREKALIVSATCFRKIFKGLYGGLECRYAVSNYQGSDSLSTAKLNEAGLTTGNLSQTVLIPTFVWDDRDNIFWSTKGYYASINFQFSNTILFSTKDYSIISGWVNGYHSLLKNSRKLTLAWHFYIQAGWGQFPYHIYANYGRGDEATGYTVGKYVNYSEATVQTELRYDLRNFISFGGYAGTGKIFRSFDVFGQSKWLHFGGVRMYINIIPSRNIRVRLDAAFARTDFGFYVGIGQGF
jgi:outer membrane protein assembly factor BamA